VPLKLGKGVGDVLKGTCHTGSTTSGHSLSHGTRQSPVRRSTSTVNTNHQTLLTSKVLPYNNRSAVNSGEFSLHHSNLTDLGGPSASSGICQADGVGAQGGEEPEQLGSIAGASCYTPESTMNPSVVSETPQNYAPPWMSGQSTRGCRKNDRLDL
jgi:hypothetical protein